MNIELLREYCLAKKGTTEGFPFDEDTLVFKVMGKMFALVSLDSSPLRVNLKSDRAVAVELRERYASVSPGYHMSKIHWNTVEINGEVPGTEIVSWIKDSYQLVVAGLPKKLRLELEGL